MHKEINIHIDYKEKYNENMGLKLKGAFDFFFTFSLMF